MEQIAFLSDGRINLLEAMASDASVRILNCTVAEKYKEREREIRLKNEWKQSGMGAMFTGAYRMDEYALDGRLPITGLSSSTDGRLVYAINLEKNGGIYFKHPDPENSETPILVNTNAHFFDVDVNPSGNIAVACSENYQERHIALLKVDYSYLQDLTEGDSFDCNPKWSLRDENILYYDSAGIAYNGTGHFAGFGPSGIFRLNTRSGELDEVLADPKFNYCYPFENKDGCLYFIRRPYKQTDRKMSTMDYIAAPFKIMRAFGGWLDLFTRRHTGESLNTSGANPAKSNQKSARQIYIDGNLLEAEKALRKNAMAGDKNPGYAPHDWQLMTKMPDGEEKVLQKSVMSYCVTQSSVVYSNGKYIISGNHAVKVHLATKLVSYAGDLHAISTESVAGV